MTKNHQKRQKSTLYAQLSVKKRRAIDIVSEIELITTSALTNASPLAANTRRVRMSSRAPKPATFVDKPPPKPAIQEAEANQATPNHPPSPNTQILQQSGTKYREHGESGLANIAAKSCLKCILRA
ncbi:MAG: hypothetical protein WEB58_10485 [Planctomycetaceae bacterium]